MRTIPYTTIPSRQYLILAPGPFGGQDLVAMRRRRSRPLKQEASRPTRSPAVPTRRAELVALPSTGAGSRPPPGLPRIHHPREGAHQRWRPSSERRRHGTVLQPSSGIPPLAAARPLPAHPRGRLRSSRIYAPLPTCTARRVSLQPRRRCARPVLRRRTALGWARARFSRQYSTRCRPEAQLGSIWAAASRLPAYLENAGSAHLARKFALT